MGKRRNRQPLSHEVLRLCKLAVVQVHVPLGRRDIRVPVPAPEVFGGRPVDTVEGDHFDLDGMSGPAT